MAAVPVAAARVVVVGSFNVDHVWSVAALPLPGETLGGSYASGPGGKGFNQAVAAARAGAATRFVCALGSDAGGQLARALAAADGIDLRDQASDIATGTAGIVVDAKGRNSIVVGAGANAALSAAHVMSHRDAFQDAAVVLAQLESPQATVLQALLLAREFGGVAMLNPAPANAVTDDALMAAVDILTPNETEFVALLQRHHGVALAAEDVSGLDDRTLHGLCRRLLPSGTIVVTLGAAGAFVSHADGMRRGDGEPCYRLAAIAVDAVDTTGAGDAFNGALAASLALHPTSVFAQHARFATRYASQSTTRAGAAMAMPHAHELT